MPRGPLPNPNRRRRNAPTIPTTILPAAGRAGPAPKPPGWMEIGKAGRAWWRWAWKTPQAAAWSDGMAVLVARRATLEDRFAALGQVPELDVADLLGTPETEATKQLEWLIGRLKALAGGEMAIAREARELDDRLGLSPKAMGQLRWSIGDLEEEQPEPVPSNVRRLKAVDPDLVRAAQ